MKKRKIGCIVAGLAVGGLSILLFVIEAQSAKNIKPMAEITLWGMTSADLFTEEITKIIHTNIGYTNSADFINHAIDLRKESRIVWARDMEAVSGGMVSDVRPLAVGEGIWIVLADDWSLAPSNRVVAVTRNIDLSAPCPQNWQDRRIRFRPEPDPIPSLQRFGLAIRKDGSFVRCRRRSRMDRDGYNGFSMREKLQWVQDMDSEDKEHPLYLYP